MRSIVVLCLIVALSGTAAAQSPASPNSTYVELFGNGLIYSFNYDHLFDEDFGMRVGAGFFPTDEFSVITFPLMAYSLIGSGSSKLELGLGVCVILQPENAAFSFMAAVDEEVRGNGALGTATLGYRYQGADGGFVFRAGVTPFFGNFSRDKSTSPSVTDYEYVFGFRWSIGVSFGYGF
jgi:hypothetical protein